MRTILCPGCKGAIEAVRVGERVNGVVVREYDRGYCPTCSRTLSRDVTSGETFATTIRPLCHVCWQELTLDLPRSTAAIHAYRCREHDQERCSYVVETAAWLWHSTDRSPTA